MSGITCPRCGALIPFEDSFCGNCGARKPEYEDNYCINENCERYKKVLENPTQKFCGKCGSSTSYRVKHPNFNVLK